jgi:predicted nucleic acid-binding protein
MAVAVSLSSRLADRLWAAGHEIVISPGILEEAREKLRTSEGLRRWLAKDDDELQIFLDGLPVLFRVAPGELEIRGEVPDDPNDDHILAAALEMSVDFIVSEDRHLLALGTWRGIPIVTRAEMMAELDRRESDEDENRGE